MRRSQIEPGGAPSTGDIIGIKQAVSRFLGARVDRHSAVGLRLSVSIVVFGLTVWAFGGLLEEILDNAWLVRLDRAVYVWSHQHVTSTGLAIFNVITALGSIGAWAVVAAVALWLWHGRHPHLLSAWLGTNVGGGILQWILKTSIHRARPQYAAVYLHGHSYSFPSGHAMQSTITYIMLVFVGSRASRQWHDRRGVLLVCASALVLLIGFSRLYLGVHYVSDVVGGVVAGTAWLALTLILLGLADDRRARLPSARGLALPFVGLFALAVPARAQNAPPTSAAPVAGGELRGRVTNGSRSPVARASIDIARDAGGATVARVSSETDGQFRIQGLQPGRYRVHVRALGYAPRDLPAVVIGAESAGVDLGTVILTAVAVEMQRVVVTERQRDVQLAPDRNSYVVSDMPTTRGGNALDVLRNVPSVDVDIDNVVSLRGNTGVVVQINGRPSPMKPGQLGNFLAQLPADMVEKVEVIPNPSARDDPEGVAGIINIVLKKESDAGVSGGVTLSGGTTGRAEIGGNLGYQRGPLSAYGSYGFLRDNRPRSDSIYRENLYLQPLTFLQERGRRTQIPLAHTMTGSLGYRLAQQDELSADLMYSTRSEAETNNILYQDLSAAHVLTGLSDRISRGTNHEFNLESTVGYKHAFVGKRHELTSELRVFRAREGGPNDFTMRALALDGTPQGISARETQTGYEHPNENALKVDYRRPLSSEWRMESGYKGSAQNIHTTLDTRVYDPVLGAYAPDVTRTSDFTYDQRVNAAYGLLNGTTGKFALQGGLRVERATTTFRLNAQNATYDNQYNSVFPSALVAYNVDDAHQIKLSYSTRIRRPDDGDLIDPTPHYQDPLNVSRGNPNLKPEYIRAVELGLQRSSDRTTLQVAPFYRHTLDAVRSLRSIDSAGVSTRTFANIATTDAYGTDATIALHGGRLSGFAGASAFRQVSNASNLDSSLSVHTFGWTARTNLSFRFSPTTDVQTLLFYQAPMTVEQGRNASRTRFSLAARQKLMNDQVSVTLRVIDPFNSSRERNTTIDPRFYQVSERRRADRGILLSANWSFGKSPKQDDRKPSEPDAGDPGGP